MKSFIDIENRMSRKAPLFRNEFYDLYQVPCSWYERYKWDYGVVFIYHFKSENKRNKAVELLDGWDQIISANIGLKVKLVPIYEVGADYIVQCKPPYDGGYSTHMYREYLDYGDFCPPAGYEHALAELRQTVESLKDVITSENYELITRYIVNPSPSLYWDDMEDEWVLYRLGLELSSQL